MPQTASHARLSDDVSGVVIDVVNGPPAQAQRLNHFGATSAADDVYVFAGPQGDGSWLKS